MERGGASWVTFNAGGFTHDLKCRVTRTPRSAQMPKNVLRGWSLPPEDWVVSSRRHPHVTHVMSSGRKVD
jgi:hypothetical protein